ncbi:MAG: MFS transporter [Armatimonadota bacterium]
MTSPAAERHYRWNFRVWTTETSLWMFATSLIDNTTVLPVLVQSLSGSPFLAGLLVSIRYAGQGIPQLFAASMISGQPLRKAFYFKVAMPGRLLLLWPAIVLLLGIETPAIAVTAILVAYLIFWISEGFSIVPWVDMVGKTVPANRRGLLFALMHIIGGILGITAGVLVRQILQSPRIGFPAGYGVLFATAMIIIIIATLSVAFLREPPSPPHEERYSTWALIKDIPNLLRAHTQFRLLVILQALFGFAFLAAPFYILYASGWLQRAAGGGASFAGVGFFLAVQTAGLIFGNAAWGHVADRYGSRMQLRVLALVHVIVPLSALVAGLLVRGAPAWGIYLAFSPTFFGFGALSTGTWMAITNFLLDIAPEHDRPAFIAVTNALNLPAAALPMAGGLLLRVIGYGWIFAIAAAFLAYAFLLSARLVEPREAHVHPHSPQYQDVEEYYPREEET